MIKMIFFVKTKWE